MANENNLGKMLDRIVNAELGSGNYGEALGISAKEIELMEECLYNYYSSGDVDQARFCAETILTTDPSNFYACMILIQLDIEADQFEKALEALEQLAETYEQDDLVDLKRVQCKLLLGEREGLEETAKRLINSEIPYVAADAKVLYDLCYGEASGQDDEVETASDLVEGILTNGKDPKKPGSEEGKKLFLAA